MKDFIIATGQALIVFVFAGCVITGITWLGTHDRYTLIYKTKTPYEVINKSISSGLKQAECETILTNFKDQTNYECMNSWKYTVNKLK